MASPAFVQILAIQASDMALSQLDHRNRSHPIRASIAQLEEQRHGVDQQYQTALSNRHELERDRKRLEDAAASLEDKRSALDKKLYGGEVTATKELVVIQDEIASLVKQRTTIEDDELEVMEQLEATEAEVNDFEAKLATIDAELGAARDELDAALAVLDAEVDAEQAKRDELASEANVELLARYEELSRQFGGIAVAQLVNGACDGCNIALSAVAMDLLSKMEDDAVVTCEECGRLLVRP